MENVLIPGEGRVEFCAWGKNDRRAALEVRAANGYPLRGALLWRQVHKRGPGNSIQHHSGHMPLFNRAKVNATILCINPRYLESAFVPDGAYDVSYLWSTVPFHRFSIRSR